LSYSAAEMPIQGQSLPLTLHAYRAVLSAAAPLAGLLLSHLLQDLDTAAARDLADYQNLHQVRIAGKRLRYAMEVFVDCFAEPFRTVLYPAVEEMRDILGHANDCHVASGRLEALCDQVREVWPAEWERYRPGLEALVRHHKRQLPRERKRFLAWWKRWKSAGVEASLLEMLQASTHRKRDRRASVSASK